MSRALAIFNVFTTILETPILLLGRFFTHNRLSKSNFQYFQKNIACLFLHQNFLTKILVEMASDVTVKYSNIAKMEILQQWHQYCPRIKKKLYSCSHTLYIVFDWVLKISVTFSNNIFQFYGLQLRYAFFYKLDVSVVLSASFKVPLHKWKHVLTEQFTSWIDLTFQHLGCHKSGPLTRQGAQQRSRRPTYNFEEAMAWCFSSSPESYKQKSVIIFTGI